MKNLLLFPGFSMEVAGSLFSRRATRERLAWGGHLSEVSRMSEWCLRAFGSSRKLSEAHGTTLSSMRTADFNGREKERDSVGASSGCENEFNSHENINRKEGFSRHRPRTLITRKIFTDETGTFQKVKVFERRGTSRDY